MKVLMLLLFDSIQLYIQCNYVSCCYVCEIEMFFFGGWSFDESEKYLCDITFFPKGPHIGYIYVYIYSVIYNVIYTVYIDLGIDDCAITTQYWTKWFKGALCSFSCKHTCNWERTVLTVSHVCCISFVGYEFVTIFRAANVKKCDTKPETDCTRIHSVLPWCLNHLIIIEEYLFLQRNLWLWKEHI